MFAYVVFQLLTIFNGSGNDSSVRFRPSPHFPSRLFVEVLFLSQFFLRRLFLILPVQVGNLV
jgi:hypothetical protein